MKLRHRIARALAGRDALLLVRGERTKAGFLLSRGCALAPPEGELCVTRLVRYSDGAEGSNVVSVEIHGAVVDPTAGGDLLDRTADAADGER